MERLFFKDYSEYHLLMFRRCQHVARLIGSLLIEIRLSPIHIFAEVSKPGDNNALIQEPKGKGEKDTIVTSQKTRCDVNLRDYQRLGLGINARTDSSHVAFCLEAMLVCVSERSEFSGDKRSVLVVDATVAH